MHTIMVIGGGLLLLALFALLGKRFGGGNAEAATAALWFLPVWLVAAGINLSVGMRHGYSFAEELPIGFVVFGVPAAVALLIWRKFAKG